MMKDEIKRACEVLQKGGVILYPTDTVWGIGCDATNEEAVKRVYEIKQRADSKAMLVLVDNPVKVDFYVQDLTQGPPANDDLDLQIVWLAAVERYGRNVNASILGEY